MRRLLQADRHTGIERHKPIVKSEILQICAEIYDEADAGKKMTKPNANKPPLRHFKLDFSVSEKTIDQ